MLKKINMAILATTAVAGILFFINWLVYGPTGYEDVASVFFVTAMAVTDIIDKVEEKKNKK